MQASFAQAGLSAFTEAQLLDNILLHQEKLAILFARFGDRSSVGHISKKILNSQAPPGWSPTESCPDYQLVRWFARIVLSSVDLPSEMDNRSFYLFIMEQAKFQYAKTIKFAFNTKPSSPMPKSEYPRLLKAIQALQHTNQSLLTAILPYLDRPLEALPPKNLFECFGIDSFEIKRTITPEFLQSFSNQSINPQNFPQFLMHLIRISDQSIALTLQGVLTLSEHYPNDSELFSSDSSLLLVNNAILKHKHFMDLLVRPAQSLLLSHDVGSCLSYTRALPMVQPFIFLSVFQTMFDDSANFEQNAQKFTSLKSSTVVENFFSILLNDFSLLHLLQNVSGTKVFRSDIEAVSIPQLLSPFLRGLDTTIFVPISKQNYSIISESQKTADFDFIFAYHTILSSISIIEKGDSPSIEKLIFNIQSQSTQDSLVNDIFSLIFLTRRDGTLVCDVTKADLLLNRLSSFMNQSTFFVSASMRIMYARLIGTNKLKDCMVSQEAAVLDSLKRNEVGMALSLSKSTPNLLNVVRLAQKMKSVRGTGQFDDCSPAFKLEYSMCFGQGMFEVKDDRSNVQQVINRRRGSQNPLDIVRLLAIQDAILHVSSDTETYTYSTPFQHLNTFLSYVSLYKQMTQYAGIPVGGRMSPSEIVAVIVKTAQIQDWKTMSTLLGTNALELVLQYSSTVALQSKIFDIISSQCMPAAATVFYSKIIGRKCKVDELRKAMKRFRQDKKDGVRKRKSSFSGLKLQGSSVDLNSLASTDVVEGRNAFDKLLLKALNEEDNKNFPQGQRMDRGSICSNLLSIEKQVGESEVVEMITFSLSIRPIPVEYLNDLYYRSPDAYIKCIRDSLPLLSPIEVSEMITFSDLPSLPFLIGLGITNLEPHSVFASLLNSSEFAVLRQFIYDFSIWKEFGEFLSTRLEEAIPKLREDNYLTEFLPFIPEPSKTKIDLYMKSIIELESSLSNGEPSKISDVTTLTKFKDEYSSLLFGNPDVQIRFQILSQTLEKIGKDEGILREWAISQIYSSISLISITSVESEALFSSIMHSLVPFAGSQKKFVILTRFIDSQLFSRYNEPYSFAECLSPDTAMILAYKCLSFDCESLMIDFCTEWNLDFSPFLIKRAVSYFKLGFFTEGSNIIHILPSKPQLTSSEPSAAIDSLVDCLSFPPSIDCQWLLEDTETNAKNLYSRLKQSPQSQSPESRKVLIDCLSHLGQSWRLLAIFSSQGSFDLVSSIFSQFSSQKSLLFAQFVVFPALSSSSWNSLWNYVNSSKGAFGDCVKDLYSTLRSRLMFTVLFDIEYRMKDNDAAITTTLEAMRFAQGWQQCLDLIGQLSFILEKLLPQGSSVKSKFTFSELDTLKRKVDLQKQLISFCAVSRIPFSNSLNLFDTNGEFSVALFMMKMGQYEYVLDLNLYVQFDFKQICTEVLDGVMRQGESGIRRFFASLSKVKGNNYQILMNVLIESVKEKVKSPGDMVSFIKRNVQGETLKGKLFLKLGFLDEAFESAKGSSNREMLMQILEQSNRKGNAEISKKCQRMLKD